MSRYLAEVFADLGRLSEADILRHIQKGTLRGDSHGTFLHQFPVEGGGTLSLLISPDSSTLRDPASIRAYFGQLAGFYGRIRSRIASWEGGAPFLRAPYSGWTPPSDIHVHLGELRRHLDKNIADLRKIVRPAWDNEKYRQIFPQPASR